MNIVPAMRVSSNKTLNTHIPNNTLNEQPKILINDQEELRNKASIPKESIDATSA